jgi:signal transduction histidine kinase
VVRAAVWLKPDAVLLIRKSIDEFPGAVSAIRHAFEIAAVIAIALMLMLAVPLAGTLVRRLQRLREVALQISLGGSGMAVEVPADRARDEVGDLARSFSIMHRRLRQQEQARRGFVATASHELRTPLASLNGMLELLEEDLRSPNPDLQDAALLLERARAQSLRLSRLAADLLDLSRIDADVELRAEPLELGEMVRAVLAEFDIASEERGVSMMLRDDAGAVWVTADPGSVARILRILLDNGLRVAPRRSTVTVAISQGEHPTLSVSDEGPGVAPEERALIFERFKRGTETGGQAGFGLGLAIGRELAERMGGTLVISDTGEPGATFTLTLPTAKAPSDEPEQAFQGA